MNTSLISPLNLLGALLVNEGLLTQAQLIACLMIQKEAANNIPLGQITVNCGYVSQEDLNRVLQIQQEIRNTLVGEIEAHQPRPSDIVALMMVTQHQYAHKHYLMQIGVQPYRPDEMPVSHPAPDIIFIDQNSSTVEFPSTSFVCMLPLRTSSSDQLTERDQQLIKSYVDLVREHNYLQHIVEHGQRDAFLIRQLSVLLQRMSSDNTAQEKLIHLMAFVRDAINVEAGTLYQIDPQTRELIFAIVIGPHQEELYRQRLSRDHGIAGWVARTGEPLLIPDVHTDERFEQAFDKKTGFQTHSVLCVPICSHHTTLGVIQLINKVDHPFNEHDLFLLQMVARVGALMHLLDDEVK